MLLPLPRKNPLFTTPFAPRRCEKGCERKVFIVSSSENNQRLDVFLSKKLSYLSRSKIACFIQKGKILVNGSFKKPGYSVKKNDRIIVNLEEENFSLKLYPLTVPILYEDDDILVVNKPCNLNSHPPSFKSQESLVNALLFMKKDLFFSSALRGGIVHRLDKETSGAMVLAKNSTSYYSLVKQFSQRQVKKEYQAVVEGLMREEEFTIELPLTRHQKHRTQMKVSFLPRSKSAFTRGKVIRHFNNYTYLSLEPLTGRTHQLRLHLAFLGNPIVGDKKYGSKSKFPYLLLHSFRLGFYHPSTGEFISFTAPLPDYFKKFLLQGSAKVRTTQCTE